MGILKSKIRSSSLSKLLLITALLLLLLLLLLAHSLIILYYIYNKVRKEDFNTFCPMSGICPFTTKSGPQWWISSQHFFARFPIFINMLQTQYYLVATVIHIQYLHIPIYIYIYIYIYSSQYGEACRAKEIKKKNREKVNTACQGNLTGCHSGTRAIGFTSPALGYSCKMSVLGCY